MLTATILKGQSLFDFALQHLGSADCAYSVARANQLPLDYVAPSSQPLSFSLDGALPEHLGTLRIISREGVIPMGGAAPASTPYRGIGFDPVGELWVS